MPSKLFESSRLKIKRAQKHWWEITEVTRAFLGRTPFWLELAEGFTADSKRWIVRVREEVPEDFSGIIGDVIHNLRAALDLMACELVRQNGNSDKDVYFPFAEDEVTLDKQIRKKHFDRASPEAVALIKKYKPYRNGNDPLRAIHDLDIIDKHQTLIPFASMIGAPDPSVRFGKAPLMFGPVRDGMSVTAADIYRRSRIGAKAPGVNFTLRFPLIYMHPTGLKAAPLGSQEVIPSLKSLGDLVEGIIEAFAAL